MRFRFLLYGGAIQSYILMVKLLYTCKISHFCRKRRIALRIYRIPLKAGSLNHQYDMDNSSWYAIRTIHCQEQKASQFLTEKGYAHFIPMTFGPSTQENPRKPTFVPAIHNLLFVEKKGTPQEMMEQFAQSPVPLMIFHHPGRQKFCEISSQEMAELRMLCDPQFKESVFMTPTEADILIGKEVRVVQGPFKGSTGKLIRKNNRFYFLKVFVGMGVMVRISRWYCKAIQPQP